MEKASDTWDVSSHGTSQLHELNSMERKQDLTKWILSSVLVASNCVLVLAHGQLGDRYLARLSVAGLGFVVSVFWLLVSMRVHKYERLWIGRAKELEKKIGVSPEFRLWDEKRLPGISGHWIILFGTVVFLAFWIIAGAYSLYKLM